jgi:hypothetical protein
MLHEARTFCDSHVLGPALSCTIGVSQDREADLLLGLSRKAIKVEPFVASTEIQARESCRKTNVGSSRIVRGPTHVAHMSKSVRHRFFTLQQNISTTWR